MSCESIKMKLQTHTTRRSGVSCVSGAPFTVGGRSSKWILQMVTYGRVASVPGLCGKVEMGSGSQESGVFIEIVFFAGVPYMRGGGGGVVRS